MRLIMEVGNDHEGSLNHALEYVDLAADHGVWCVKFQHHDPVLDPVQTFRIGTQPPQYATRRDYWRRVSFSRSEWSYLASYAKGRGVLFGVSLSHACSVGALHGLVDVWKVPHTQYLNRDIVDALCDCTVIVSCPLGPLVGIRADRLDVARMLWGPETPILQCRGEYPTDLDRVYDLGSIRQYDGISSHCPSILPALRAYELGCDYCEIHVTKSLRPYTRGPDGAVSVDIDEFRELARKIPLGG